MSCEFHKMRHSTTGVAVIAVLYAVFWGWMGVSRVDALEVVFDYRYDTNGVFDDPGRRASLEYAASFYSRFTDDLLAIEPSGSNHWSVSFTRPDGAGTVVVDDLSVARGSVTVFVGGWSFHPSVLGWAGSGNIESIDGDAAWEDLVLGRGQAGALDVVPTDFGPWGGAITINSNVNWHFDPHMLPEPGEQDFVTTAMHELGHVLGFGDAGSWFSQVSGSEESGFLFEGVYSMALAGGAVALDRYGAHWAGGTMSSVDGVLQETAMDPSTPRGERQSMTALDYAGFADIGWVVPEPGTISMVGLMLLIFKGRRGVGCRVNNHPFGTQFKDDQRERRNAM